MDEFLPIKSFRVKNFKGIRDSGEVRFTPLTVFIGNNGSGKSSLIEALQTYQDIVVNGLDKAMNRWRGFENIHNPPISLVAENGQKEKKYIIEFVMNGLTHYTNLYQAKMITGLANNKDDLNIIEEKITLENKTILRMDSDGTIFFLDEDIGYGGFAFPNISLLNLEINNKLIVFSRGQKKLIPIDLNLGDIAHFINYAQFIVLNPTNMIHPLPLQRTGGKIRLNPDGSNIAEYLMDIRKQDQDAYEGIIEALTYVLPYLKDMQPNLTTELERTVYLRMHEDTYTIPQWLLSTGTMRILCLLALFRHPTPPPVIFIEEIENGLDPRTIHFVVEEIRNLVTTGTSQVVITTHSPYLLDLLDISQIVVVERENGETKFSRPADDESLQIWAKKFSPGSLYTMSKLTRS